MAATKAQIKERKNGDEADRSGNGSLTRKAYERELARLHGELVKLQQWVVAKGLKVVIVFEGRDGAGKAGSLKRSRNACVPGSFVWPRCPRRPNAKSRRCTSSAISGICRPLARSSSSIVAGTTAPASSG